MNQSSAIPSRLVALIIMLVGINVVGLTWMSASLSRMATSLESLGSANRATRQAADEPSLANSLLSAGPAAGLQVQGITRPDLCLPDQVDLAPNELVIGIELNGEPRAYVVKAFEAPDVQSPDDLSVHVVNDVLGNLPISVTHCDMTHSTRVLTQTSNPGAPTVPLDVRIGGWQGGMLLVVDEQLYPHHAPELPLNDVPFLTTTWSKWRNQYPNSLVYTGLPCDS